MAKRANGEGSIRKLPSGSWRAEIMDGFTDAGKRNIVRFTGKTKAEVQEKLREHQRLIDLNVHLDKNIDFSTWADTWYEDYKSQVQPSTYAGYKYTLKLLKKHFGQTPICSILPIHVNRFTDRLVEQGYSISQLRKCRAMLIQIFYAAEDNGLIVKNPAVRAKKIRKKDKHPAQNNHKKDAFTDEEIIRLNHGLPEDLIGNGTRAMLGTGMRVQELLALTKEDIAEDGSTVEISKAIEMVNGKPQLDVPKSECSYRTIPVPNLYRKALIFLRENSGEDRIYQPGDKPYYGVGSFRRRYYTALKKIEGVRMLTPHCCRHTYATQLEKKRVPLQMIATLMGHASAEVTGEYLHTNIETLTDAVSVLN